jgi:hypothetical protein
MITVLKLTNLEKAALLLGAMVHDVDHPYKLCYLGEKETLT